jgi:hypothetical protein
LKETFKRPVKYLPIPIHTLAFSTADSEAVNATERGMLLSPVSALLFLFFGLTLSLLHPDMIPAKQLSLQKKLLFSLPSLSDVVIAGGSLIICLSLLWAQEQFLD